MLSDSCHYVVRKLPSWNENIMYFLFMVETMVSCNVFLGTTTKFSLCSSGVIYYSWWVPPIEISCYPMLRADSRFWLVSNHEIWSRISRLTSSAWDIKTKERHWWCHNGDSDHRPYSLSLCYDLVTLFIWWFSQINVIAVILNLRKHFRMSQILFEHGINSLPLVCFHGYGNLSTLSITIPRLSFGRAWYCDAACG